MAINVKRMRIGLLTAIVIALGILILPKGYALWHWGTSDPADEIPILVADHYISAFTVIKPALVRVQVYPKTLVPPGALHATAELQNESGQMFFTAAISIPEGQPITRALVTDATQSDTLAALILPGKVAVSFEIDKAHGVGGWIRPGDTVALFGAVPMDLKGQRVMNKKTRLLLPSVQVVAVDAQRVGQNKIPDNETDSVPALESPLANSTKIVTVLVNPTDASAIIEAREDGSLSVVLRSLGDDIPWPLAK